MHICVWNLFLTQAITLQHANSEGGLSFAAARHLMAISENGVNDMHIWKLRTAEAAALLQKSLHHHKNFFLYRKNLPGFLAPYYKFKLQFRGQHH